MTRPHSAAIILFVVLALSLVWLNITTWPELDFPVFATPPTFQEYSVNQVINVKSVRGLPVAGDGVTDE